MKEILFTVLCFFAMQIIACSGTIEAEPGATKFSIKNDSKAYLQNVKWNTVEFGNIDFGETSEREVFAGQAPLSFELKDGKRYRTWDYIETRKYRRDTFYIHDNTFVTSFESSSRFLLGDVLNAD
ncbi:MAG: hypothetical protein LBB36_01340 [Fibromonadaceae bacterium]|jgi:hypothetical protein|nr:hypothetical protein [Fibromonadaceae bacterium]